MSGTNLSCPAAPGQTPMRSRRVSDGETPRAVGAARHPPVTPTSPDFVETVQILATTVSRWATVTGGLAGGMQEVSWPGPGCGPLRSTRHA